MLMLKALLRLFPRAFRDRFGQEWLEVSQQLLSRGQENGPEGITRSWVNLCLDVGVQAPVAHAKEVWRAVMGTPPVLAGAGVLGGAWLLTKHWGGRPAMALGHGLIKYLWALGAGGLFAMVLHEWLAQRAWMGGFEAAQMGQMGLDRANFTNNPQSLVVVVALPLAAVMVVAGWPRLKAGIEKITVKLVLGGLLAFGLGFYLVLTSIFVSQLREVANDVLSDFIVYPEIAETPAGRPSSENPEEWTAEQKQWFDPAYPWNGSLLPEKKTQWCDIKENQLGLWYKTIVSRESSSAGISLLLWQAQQGTHFAQGCIDEPTWLKRHDDAAFSIQQGQAYSNAPGSRWRPSILWWTKSWRPITLCGPGW